MVVKEGFPNVDVLTQGPARPAHPFEPPPRPPSRHACFCFTALTALCSPSLLFFLGLAILPFPFPADHTPSVPAEAARVRQAGGQVERGDPMDVERVYPGGLAVSRAIGDLPAKHPIPALRPAMPLFLSLSLSFCFTKRKGIRILAFFWPPFFT